MTSSWLGISLGEGYSNSFVCLSLCLLMTTYTIYRVHSSLCGLSTTLVLQVLQEYYNGDFPETAVIRNYGVKPANRQWLTPTSVYLFNSSWKPKDSERTSNRSMMYTDEVRSCLSAKT